MLRLEVPNLYFDIFADNIADRCDRDWCQMAPLAAHHFAPLNKPVKCPKPNEHQMKQAANAGPMSSTTNHFNVNLDLSSFAPSEISVKLEENSLVVRCEHELSGDGQYESRRFIKKVPLPANCLAEQIRCQLDQHGQLHIEVPLETMQAEAKNIESAKAAKPMQESPTTQTKQPEVVIEDIGPEF